jgi:hypothetical protein
MVILVQTSSQKPSQELRIANSWLIGLYRLRYGSDRNRGRRHSLFIKEIAEQYTQNYIRVGILSRGSNVPQMKTNRLCFVNRECYPSKDQTYFNIRQECPGSHYRHVRITGSNKEGIFIKNMMENA